MFSNRKKYHIKLSVPEPCTQDWNEMRTDGDGRHCMHCRKTVINFTGMTDAELLAYFKNKSSQSCGRFYADQLGRIIEEAVPQKPRWWLRVAAGALLLFGMAKDGKAQEKAAKENSYWVANEKREADEPAPEPAAGPDSVIIKGTLVDGKNQPIIGGSVTIQSGGISVAGSITDYDGNYKIFLLPAGLMHREVIVEFAYQANKISYTMLLNKNPLVVDGKLRLTGTILGGMGMIVIQKKAQPFLQPKGVYRTIYFDRQ